MVDCPDISAPDSEELLQFAIEPDSLPDEKRIHLEQCLTCQQRLQVYRRVDEALVTRFYRRFCPDGMQLSLYCESLLSPEEQIQVAHHLLDCPVCSLEVVQTRLFLRDVPALIEERSTPLSTLRRTFGVLIKSRSQAVATRQDGDPSAHVWPRQYHIDDVDLSLHLSRAGNGEQVLLGILTNSNNAEHIDAFVYTRAELYTGPLFTNITADAAPYAQTQVDDLGNLIFRPVSSGEYVLLIHLPAQDLIIERITIE